MTVDIRHVVILISINKVGTFLPNLLAMDESLGSVNLPVPRSITRSSSSYAQTWDNEPRAEPLTCRSVGSFLSDLWDGLNDCVRSSTRPR